MRLVLGVDTVPAVASTIAEGVIGCRNLTGISFGNKKRRSRTST
ncbi:hypothetical protein M758_5G035300 [Ceratodon purpureus]|uniref:Uncharacterized protein n=1 Tax=Ceratodon purpureus TaxID=3225 RepID=A0A8T0HZL1_CERPU|nr:hypothetical protein KC19_5G035400 [Ceratodon purpureus]KAG0615363.1 hypothetical protein M758_5G035300 [Ceratodon purpureus]